MKLSNRKSLWVSGAVAVVLTGSVTTYLNTTGEIHPDNPAHQSSEIAPSILVPNVTKSQDRARPAAEIVIVHKSSTTTATEQPDSDNTTDELPGQMTLEDIAAIPQSVIPEDGILDSHVIEGPDGNDVFITKYLNGQEINKVYEISDGSVMNKEEFMDYVRAFPAKKTSAELDQYIAENPDQEKLLVLVQLNSEARRHATQAAKVHWQEEVDHLSDEFRNAEESEEYAINEAYDAVNTEIRSATASLIDENLGGSRSELVSWLEENGSHVKPGTPVSMEMISAEIPSELLASLIEKEDVRLVELNAELEASLDVSVPSINADEYWDGGIDGGESAYDPGILDSGIDTGHPALSGLTVNYHIDHYWASRNSSYDDSWSNSGDYHGHGTAVTGIVTSKGSTTWEDWEGVAPGITSRLYNLKSAYLKTGGSSGLYYSDAIDNIDWGIFDSSADDIDLLNFSYGSSTSSDDSSLSRFMDAVVDDLDIPVIVAAGNYGSGSTTISYPGNAYNILSVASMNDINTLSRSDDVIAYSSSRGTTWSGRKKPDITAPGSYIQTTNSKWETQSDFTTWSGTSFAAPHITGAVQLLMDEYGPPADPLKVKAVLINSTDKWGSLEWNATYGWGYVNLENAWDQRDDVFRYNVSPAGASDDFDLFVGTFEAGDTATLVWNRHVDYASNGNYPSTWYGLNDLDLRVYRLSDGVMLDWATSGIDNVEQVTITSAATPCVIRVEAEDSSFSGVSQESYALATPSDFSFYSSSSHPSIEVLTYSDSNIQPGEEYKVTSVILNSGGLDAVNVDLDLTLPSGHTLVSGSASVDPGTLLDSTDNKAVVVWEVEAPGTEGSGNVTTDVDSVCWGETWSDSDYRTIQVNDSADTQPRIRVAATNSLVSATTLNTVFTVTADVSNEATQSSGDASDVSVDLTLPSGYELVSGSNPTNISTLNDGATTTVNWTVRGISDEAVGTHGFRILATDTDGGSILRGTDATFVSLN